MLSETHGPLSRTIRLSRYQKGKTNLDFIEARDSEWQWHQLGRMQVCTYSWQITTPAPHHSFLQAGRPFCRPINSVKALKAQNVAKTFTLFGFHVRIAYGYFIWPLSFVAYREMTSERVVWLITHTQECKQTTDWLTRVFHLSLSQHHHHHHQHQQQQQQQRTHCWVPYAQLVTAVNQTLARAHGDA